jgi:ribonuclease PH
MAFVRDTAVVGGKEITIETGKWAKQASGSVIIRCGDSMVLVTAQGSAQPRDIDFMPLTCEYQEKFYSSGKIPGSFFRREGRTTNAEILICRLMDRPVRPLFPKGWFIDTQIIANVVSFDKENATDVLAMTGASCAVHVSDLVWGGPLAGVRVGRVDGQFVANPTFAEREKSDMEGYVGHLARFLPEPAAEAATEVPQSVSAAEPPRRQTLAVLGIEFRQMQGVLFANPRRAIDIANPLARLTKLQSVRVATQDFPGDQVVVASH